jgi:DNA-binding MarR family transcriptional regulator
MSRPLSPEDPAPRPFGAEGFPPTSISRADFLRDGSDAWFRGILYRFIQAADRLHRCREAFGQSAGLTGNQFLVLMGVAYLAGDDAGRGVSIATLASHIGLAAPHVTTDVGRLARRGILSKRPDRDDRRVVLVSLTKAGRLLVEDLISLVRPVNDVLFRNVSAADLCGLLTLTERLVANADAFLPELQARVRAGAHLADTSRKG